MNEYSTLIFKDGEFVKFTKVNANKVEDFCSKMKMVYPNVQLIIESPGDKSKNLKETYSNYETIHPEFKLTGWYKLPKEQINSLYDLG